MNIQEKPGQGPELQKGQSDGGNSGPGSKDENPRHDDKERKVSITVDNVIKKVREGDWIVSELKTEVGVDAAKVLAEITASGLKDLDDTAHIKIRDKMRFMSHARTGGSS